jgi:hypothetical protein
MLIVVLWIQAWAGGGIWKRFSTVSDLDALGVVSLNVGVGTVLAAFLAAGIPSLDGFGHHTLLLAAGTLARSNRRSRRTPTMSDTPTTSPSEIAVVSAIALLCLSSARPWWSVGAAILGVLQIPGIRRRTPTQFALLAIPAAWGASALIARLVHGHSSVLTLLSSGDDLDFEAYSRSVAAIGPLRDLMSLDEPLIYHFLSFAWIGGLTEATGTAAWAVLTTLTPVVVVLTVAGLTRAWILRFGNRRHLPAVALLALLATARPGEPSFFLDFASVSLIVGHMWLLVTLVFLCEPPTKVGQTLFLASLLSATVLAKVHTGLLAIVAIGMATMVMLCREPRHTTRRIVTLGLLTGLPAVTFVVLLSPLSRGSSEYSDRLELTLNTEFLGAQLWLPISLLIVFLRSPWWPHRAMYSTFPGLISTFLALLGLLGAVGHRSYLTGYSNFYLLALLGIASALSAQLVINRREALRHAWLLGCAILVGLTLTLSFAWLNFTGHSTRVMDGFLISAAISQALLLCALWTRERLTAKERPVMARVMTIWALACIGFGVGAFSGHVVRGYVAQLARDQPVLYTASGYSEDIIRESLPLARWLSTNTCRDDVIAVATAKRSDDSAQRADPRVLIAYTGRQMYVSPGGDTTATTFQRRDLLAVLSRGTSAWNLPEWDQIVREGVTVVILDHQQDAVLPPRTLYEDDSFVAVAVGDRPLTSQCRL